MKFLPFVSASVALAVATLAGTAFAHPGPHEDVDTLSDALSHVMGSPDHASWLILGLTAVLSIVAIKAVIRITSSEKSDERG